ncbi:flavin reductase family protein [Allonocardiopsis opalescens]|uniref:3-hydroxy-9,10-secoandrosta-1,3,5(10)-triene-9, 17-dione monooxygenase reductase component n=1 Tax=Allonocardiopsis opalescens TaxID=1144618 RepID=A0A2T0Q2M0_9ACTN|nr:flavin reductase family protein [Allonocardiopsis opalescens]PRX98047.1 3-hydroxy-9,10-secoandrosta-1,3,5(10)-triene-9,17-dione monooxygenase reductase component [Allonocardiopsis opalescens]
MVLAEGFRPAEPRSFRTVLGHFCTGVTVITTEHGGPAGFTCQAFNALSMDPPLVLFCVSNTSATWPRIRAAGFFCVNVLAAGQAELGRRFAARTGGRFDRIDCGSSPGGAPMLPGAAAWIDCTLESHFPRGDHTIAIGRVTEMLADSTRDPLLYYRGRLGV